MRIYACDFCKSRIGPYYWSKIKFCLQELHKISWMCEKVGVDVDLKEIHLCCSCTKKLLYRLEDLIDTLRLNKKDCLEKDKTKAPMRGSVGANKIGRAHV